MIDINKIQKRKKNNTRPNFIGVYLNGDICQEFRDWCVKFNVTHSGLINALIREHLEKYTNRKEQNGNTSTSCNV